MNITLLTVFLIGTGWNHLVPIGNSSEIIPSGPIRIDLSDRNPVRQIGQIPYYLGGTVFQNFQAVPTDSAQYLWGTDKTSGHGL